MTRPLQARRIVVTGGAGFIGSELARQLVAAGARPLIIDNLVNGKRSNLNDIAGDVDLLVADIRDQDKMAAALSGADLVYHLACLGVRHSLHAPIENHAVNASATLDLLAIARRHGVGRFVYVSSSEVYGTARDVPMTELHPTIPETVYGAGKLAGECYARAYWRSFGFPTVMVRPFNAFGPRSHHEGDSGEVIPKFMLRAMAGQPLVLFGDGSQTRDFTFVADTARGILACGAAEAAVGETVNLGSGREVSIRDLAGEVQAVLGSAVPVVQDRPRPGDVLRLCADSSRAKALLGFTGEVGLRAGLTALRDWYLAQPGTPAELLAGERVHNWTVEEQER